MILAISAPTFVINAKTMLYLEDKSPPYSFVPLLYQLFIPSARKVERNEGRCFRIRTPKIFVESRLTLLCVCHFETYLQIFPSVVSRCLVICEQVPHISIGKLWKFPILASVPAEVAMCVRCDENGRFLT